MEIIFTADAMVITAFRTNIKAFFQVLDCSGKLTDRTLYPESVRRLLFFRGRGKYTLPHSPEPAGMLFFTGFGAGSEVFFLILLHMAI
jgi:hypothetical protein